MKNRNTYLNLGSFKDLSFEIMSLPLKIYDFSTKVIICLSKNKFFKNSLISILEYMLDINKRTGIRIDCYHPYYSIISTESNYFNLSDVLSKLAACNVRPHHATAICASS